MQNSFSYRVKQQPTTENILSKSKRRLFFSVTVFLPAVVLFLLECGLRLFNYGPNLSLFTSEQIAGQTLYVMNPDVKNRYFIKTEFSANTSVDYFQIPKPKGIYRIFCLGGSTTVGFPYGFIGSFSTFLRDRLRATFPQKQIEIINLGLTATNSYTVADIAHEIINYEPDLIIVYDGHNEFYGAFGIASRESLGNSRWIVKMYLSLVHYKTFVLIRNTFSTLTEMLHTAKSTQNGPTLMEHLAKGQYIEYKSDLYNDALEIYKANVEEVKVLCAQEKIPIIFSTQVSNVRDLPPFISEHQTNLSAEGHAQFNQSYKNGIQSKDSAQFEHAIEHFTKSLTIDSLYAGTYYYLAQCYDTLGNKKEALEAYNKARDFDQLRFRMSNDFNESLIQSHTENVVDIERTFQEHSRDGIIGYNLILEHLHPNMQGYFLMAKAYSQSMRKRRLLATEEEWNRSDTISDETLSQNKSITYFDEACAQIRIDMLTSNWPFPKRVQNIQKTTDSITTIAEQVVRAQKTWEQGHVAAAEVFQQQGKLKNAEAEYRALVSQLPYNVSAYLRLGQMLIQQKRFTDAKSIFEKSLSVERTSYAYRTLAGIALQTDETISAINFLEQAFAISHSTAERLETGYTLAVVYAKNGKLDLAQVRAQELLAINPAYSPAQTLLQKIREATR